MTLAGKWNHLGGSVMMKNSLKKFEGVDEGQQFHCISKEELDNLVINRLSTRTTIKALITAPKNNSQSDLVLVNGVEK